jgi:hypothetical protein
VKIAAVKKAAEIADELGGLKHAVRYSWPEFDQADYAVLSLILQQVAQDLQEILGFLGQKIQALQVKEQLKKGGDHGEQEG